MSVFQPQPPVVRATVNEILPRAGLAFAVDEEHREWTITKGMPGDDLDTLAVGSRVQLHLMQHKHWLMVSEYHRTD